MEPNQFDRDKSELGWRAAMGLWLENRAIGPKLIGWNAEHGMTITRGRQHRDGPMEPTRVSYGAPS